MNQAQVAAKAGDRGEGVEGGLRIDALTEIQNLSNAIEILNRASSALTATPFPIWQKVKHAKQMLENQVADIIGDPEKQRVNRYSHD